MNFYLIMTIGIKTNQKRRKYYLLGTKSKFIGKKLDIEIDLKNV